MRSSVVIRIATVAGLLSPVIASAQSGSLLWLAEPAGRLVLDKETRGSLSASDHFAPNDAFLDVWEIEGKAGESVTIDMKSDDFDAMLFLVGPGLAETLADDDGAGRCDARITVRFLEDGIYRVAATVNGSRITGVYSLYATTEPQPPSMIPCGGPDPGQFLELTVAGTIEIGATGVTGSLDSGDAVLEDGTYGEAWRLIGVSGRTVRIRLESEDFDAFLYLVGSDGVYISDDDSGGDLDSEIHFVFPADGEYRIIVSSAAGMGTGMYTLTVSE